jgi:outer membrane lipoprotein-sorting protein
MTPRVVSRRASLRGLAGLALGAFGPVAASRVEAAPAGKPPAGKPPAGKPPADKPPTEKPPADKPPAPMPIAEALDALARARQGLVALAAAFTQVRTIALLDERVTSRGELTVACPERLRWELAPPDDVVYWIGPEGASARVGQGKVTRIPREAGALAGALGDVLALVGGDLRTLASRYAMTAEQFANGAIRLVATPNDAATKRAVASLVLVTTPARWGLARVELHEPGGDASVVAFENNRKNPPIDPARMRPPGG